MPVPTDITAGTLTITNGSTAVTGTGTTWLASDLRQGDVILWIEGGDGFQTPILADVPSSNTALTLVEPWEGPTLTGVRYRIRYQWDSSRVSAQSRQLIELLDNGNVLALTGLTGPGVPVFDGPHSMVIRPTQDFINGVAYDVQVDTLPDRAAYDAQATGFAVLVSDVGDGRSALYSKASNTSGDWTDPAYVTGGVGPTPDIEATVVNTAPGTAPTVTPVPITGGTRLEFTLPAAEGFYNAGVYDIGEAYTQDQVVRYNGSSFIALQAVPAGTSPSSTMPPVDTAYWQVLAVKGTDGTGTGDVVGPSSAVNNRIAVFSGTTGKLIADSGVTVADVVPADNSITNTKLADVPTGTIKGRVSAGTGDPQDLTASQVNILLRPVKISFRAHKNGTNQTGIASGTPTKMTFGTEDWDDGGYYDVTTSRFTPPAGKYRLSCSLLTAGGAVDQAVYGPLIYKNGVQLSVSYFSWSGAINSSAVLTDLVSANGTDYFEIYFEAFGAGTKSIDGAVARTYFSGEQV